MCSIFKPVSALQHGGPCAGDTTAVLDLMDVCVGDLSQVALR